MTSIDYVTRKEAVANIEDHLGREKPRLEEFIKRSQKVWLLSSKTTIILYIL